MGIKRGNGQGSFIRSVTSLLETFYGEVAQELFAWTPKAPRLPDSDESDEAQPAEPEVIEVPTEPTIRVDQPDVGHGLVAHNPLSLDPADMTARPGFVE